MRTEASFSSESTLAQTDAEDATRLARRSHQFSRPRTKHVCPLRSRSAQSPKLEKSQDLQLHSKATPGLDLPVVASLGLPCLIACIEAIKFSRLRCKDADAKTSCNVANRLAHAVLAGGLLLGYSLLLSFPAAMFDATAALFFGRVGSGQRLRVDAPRSRRRGLLRRSFGTEYVTCGRMLRISSQVEEDVPKPNSKRHKTSRFTKNAAA